MIANGIFISIATIEENTGLIGIRYKTQDGRYILDYHDLKRANLSEEEKNTLVRVSAQEAKSIIIQNNYKK